MTTTTGYAEIGIIGKNFGRAIAQVKDFGGEFGPISKTWLVAIESDGRTKRTGRYELDAAGAYGLRVLNSSVDLAEWRQRQQPKEEN